MADIALGSAACGTDAQTAIDRAIEMLNVARALIGGPAPDWETACHMARQAEAALHGVQAPLPRAGAARPMPADRIDLSLAPSSMEMLAASWRGNAATKSGKEPRHG